MIVRFQTIRDANHAFDNSGCTEPDALEVVTGVRMKPFVRRAISEVLEDMKLFAEEQKLLVGHRRDGKDLAQTEATFLTRKADKKDGEGLEAIEREAFARPVLTDRAQHLAQFEAAEEGDRVDDRQTFDIVFEVVHGRRDRAGVADDVELSLQYPLADHFAAGELEFFPKTDFERFILHVDRGTEIDGAEMIANLLDLQVKELSGSQSALYFA